MHARAILGILLIVTMIILSGCQRQRPVDAIRQSADFHYAYERYATAAEEYAEITARYPGDWRAQYRLGLSLKRTNRLSEARRALEVAHTHRPRDMEIAEALAEVMFRQEDEQHLFAFLGDLADRTGSVRAYRMLAHYALESGDPDSAKIAINTAIRLDEGRTVGPYLDAADLAERLGDLDEAVRRLRQAYGIDPRNEQVKHRLRELGEVPGPTIALPPDR